jgi:tetrahydromethanopterin S-methyltransferase subunit C
MRLIVLILSLASVVFYGKALAGLGSYLVGKGHPELMVIGLAGGTVTAVAALVCWKRYLRQIEEEEGNRN